MTILRYADLTLPAQCQTFRNGSWLALAGVAALLAGMSAVLFIQDTPDRPVHLWWVPGLVAFGLFLLFLERVRVCRKQSAWLLKSAPDGLYVNLRSFHNYHLPPESHRVVFIPRKEIAALCKTHEIRLVPGRRQPHRDQHSYIDIFLVEGVALDGLRKTLHEERRQTVAPGRFRRAKRDDYPVRVLDPPGVRLRWEWIKPGEVKALDLLGKTYPIAPDQQSRPRVWEKLSAEEREALILDFWEWGQVEDAVSLGKMEWSVGSYRARKRVEEMAQTRRVD